MKAAPRKGGVLIRLREGWRWLAVGMALPIWALAAAFWRQDAIDPLTAPALLLDRALQVLTLALIPAAALALLAGARPALYAVSFTGTVGIMLGTAVTLSGAIRPPLDWNAVALAVVALGSGVALVVRHARPLPELRSVRGGAVAFLLASAIPVLELFNSASFLPSRTEATLDQEVTLRVAAMSGDGFRTELDYEVTNPTSARIIVVVTRLTVCWWAAQEEPVFEDNQLVGRTNCVVSHPINAQSWVSPESTLRYTRALIVDRDRPRVTVIARIAYARGDRLRTSDDSIKRSRIGPCVNVRAVRLEEESRVKSLAETAKYLMYGDYDGDGGVNYDFETGPEIDCPPGDPAGLREYFGATDGRQTRQVWLTPPDDRAGAEDSGSAPVR